MDRRVIWTELAWRDVESAAAYIAKDSPRYAAALIDAVVIAARSLSKSPERGRIVPESKDASIRELFVKRYRLIYATAPDRVIILAFLHGARDLNPGGF